MVEKWFIVIFVIDGKGNHVGLYSPSIGLADLSLAGARIINIENPKFPEGVSEYFPITISNQLTTVGFLEKTGALCKEILDKERAFKGWHLTKDAPDFVLTLREKRSRNTINMNCVEWIVRALELGGTEVPNNILTPDQLWHWCKGNTSDGVEANN